MKPELYLIALSTLASEDLACIAAGVLVAKGQISFAAAVLACGAGIFGGDLLLFFAGRLAGWKLLHIPLVARYLPAERVQSGLEWIMRRGLPVVLISRFTPGLRLPVYFAAGVLGASPGGFAAYFLLAAAIWTPILVGASWALGEGVLRSVLTQGDSSGAAIAAAAAFGFLLRHAARNGPSIALPLRRLFHWEFWPAWLAYLPLLPYFLFLSIRHRSITLFTAANPGIPTGGLVGESKSAILDRLQGAGSFVLAHRRIPASLSAAERLDRTTDFIASRLPAVLKPDVGERGDGVAIVRSQSEIVRYVDQNAGRDFLVQRYADGVEFGIFYCRYPGQPCGRIASLTAKQFPILVGDGESTVGLLIGRDARASLIADTYARLSQYPMQYVPAAGEEIQLVEIGSHCRGAIFVDAAHLVTPALETSVDRLAKAYPGFYFGRFDVRASSPQALQRGEFQVIELNGVGAESTHIYDPAVSIWAAYRAMFAQWRSAFEIGAINRSQGSEPVGFWPLLRAVWAHRRRARR